MTDYLPEARRIVEWLEDHSRMVDRGTILVLMRQLVAEVEDHRECKIPRDVVSR